MARRVRGRARDMTTLGALAFALAFSMTVRAADERRLNTFTTGDQRFPSVSADPSGDLVVVFSGQDASYASEIFGRRFSAKGFGSPMGAEFRVNTVAEDSQLQPRVGKRATGAFVVVWESTAGAFDTIRGQIFQLDGDPAGVEFRVNSYTSSFAGDPDIAVAASGEFVVTWIASQPSDPSIGIFLQRYNANGVPLALELRVNTHTSGNQSAPAIAANFFGDFVVVWGNQDDLDIHGQRFSDNGVPLGAAFRVNSASTQNALLPAVAYSQTAGFVVAWETSSGGGGDHVMMRRFEANGVPLGDDVQVSTSTAFIARPKVAILTTGEILVSWSGLDGSGDSLLARRFAVNGGALGDPFRVNAFTTGNQSFSALAVAGSAFAVVWQSDGQDGSADGVFGRLVAGDAPFDAGDFRVNTYTTGNQAYGEVLVDPAGSFTVVWASLNQDGDNQGVFSRSFTEAGTPTSFDARVNTVTSGFQNFPDIARIGPGVFVVVWQEGGSSEDTENFIAGRRFLGTRQHPLGAEFRANTVTPGGQQLPRVAGSESGFVVVWTDVQTPTFSVEAQRFAADGAPLGPEFRAHSYADGTQSDGTVAMDAEGNFVIAWRGRLAGTTSDAVIRRFQANGQPIGGDLRVNSVSTSSVSNVALDMDDSGAFVVAWSQLQDASVDVFARRFGANAQPIGAEFRVNTVTNGSQVNAVPAQRSSGELAVLWSQDLAAPDQDVFAQRFGRSGRPLYGELRVNTVTSGAQTPTDAAYDGEGRFLALFTSAGTDGKSVVLRRIQASVPGDANGDGVVTVTDVLYLINFLFAAGPPPVGEADVNADRAVTVTDILYLINFLFAGGPAPL